jgi:hypothetical protein
MQAYTTPSGRLNYLEGLAFTMADNFLYTQCTSYKYSACLKRAGELLAKEVGGVFAKAWKPKSAASIASKLYCRRGQTVLGWLTDAIQGRVVFETPGDVTRAAAYFKQILQVQAAAVKAAGRPVLNDSPSGDCICRYTTEGLPLHDNKAIDELATYLTEMADEGELHALLFLLAWTVCISIKRPKHHCCGSLLVLGAPRLNSQHGTECAMTTQKLQSTAPIQFLLAWIL